MSTISPILKETIVNTTTDNIGAKRRKPQKTNKVTQQDEENSIIEEVKSMTPDITLKCTPSTSDAEILNNKHALGTTTLVQPINGGPGCDSQVYKCPLCSVLLNSQKDFTTHIRSHNEVKPHSDPGDPSGQAKVYYCCLCGKMLSSFSSLDRHMLVHSGERPFSCNLCGQTFTTNGNMHRHKRTHASTRPEPHLTDSIDKPKSGRKRKSALEPCNTKPFTPPQVYFNCPICRETCHSGDEVDNHYASVHEQQELQCPECPFKVTGFSFYKVHRSMFHDPSNAYFSSTKFPQLAKALTPEASNYDSVENKPEECSESSSIFGDNDPYIKDMKLKGEFPCRLCPAIYPNLRALKGHNKEHLDKAPYSCNVGACQYSSGDKSTLTRHMRIHTGEKPYECKICGYGFTTKANCERHLKNKHGKATREEIKESITVHESEDGELSNEVNPKQFRCKVCKIMLSSSNKIIAHALKEHPEYSKDADKIFEEVYMDDDNEGDLSQVPRTESPIIVDDDENEEELQMVEEPCEDLPLDLSRKSKTDSSSPKPFSSPFSYRSITNIPPAFPLFFPAFGAMMNPGLSESFQAELMKQRLKLTAGALIEKEPTEDPKAIFELKKAPEAEYKMIIKNGILMKKQKQRRYRTERPYGCQHCSARFTLRSNMERHIKQQHPDHWSQKPRGSRVRNNSSNNNNTFKSDSKCLIEGPYSKLIIDDQKKEDGEETCVDEEDNKKYQDGLVSVSRLLSTASQGTDFPKLNDEPENSTLSHKNQCLFCQSTFSWSSSLRKHLKLHIRKSSLTCSVCIFSFSSKLKYDRHMVRKHKEKVIVVDEKLEESQCKYCLQDSFLTLLELLKHQVHSHLPTDEGDDSDDEEFDDEDNKIFKCFVCSEDRVYTKREDALLHFQLTHSEISESMKGAGVFRAGLNDSVELEEGNDNLSCFVCLSSFGQEDTLRAHATSDHMKVLAYDSYCKEYTMEASLASHKNTHESAKSSKVRKRANLMEAINKLSQSHHLNGNIIENVFQNSICTKAP